MKEKTAFFKKIIICVLCIILAIPVPAAMAYSQLSDELIDIEDYTVYIKSLDNQSESMRAFEYMSSAIDENELSSILREYQLSTDSDKEALEQFKMNLESIYVEAQANDFNKEQAAALFKSAADLETGNAETMNLNYSEQIPDWAPSHTGDMQTQANVQMDVSVDLLGANDISSRTDYETTGLGYEVQSVPGYNKTTTYFYPGDCNINLPESKDGVASYMFYTINYGGHAQDLGVVYYHGYWQPFVSGYWTNWGTGSKQLEPDDKLYMKLWITKNKEICFQGIDGNNFNNILFQGLYPTNTLPSSGNGVAFNRQVTYAANENNQGASGYYVKNARFDQSYLYNDNVTERFQDFNTVATRRGKFGCTWQPVSSVKINSNIHWSSEDISIFVE